MAHGPLVLFFLHLSHLHVQIVKVNACYLIVMEVQTNFPVSKWSNYVFTYTKKCTPSDEQGLSN